MFVLNVAAILLLLPVQLEDAVRHPVLQLAVVPPLLEPVQTPVQPTLLLSAGPVLVVEPTELQEAAEEELPIPATPPPILNVRQPAVEE
jgi:hypothetical protein